MQNELIVLIAYYARCLLTYLLKGEGGGQYVLNTIFSVIYTKKFHEFFVCILFDDTKTMIAQ